MPGPRVVVVGAGVMGTWTALHLRRSGLEVTLVDAYGPGNSLASSGDESRVTRSAHGADRHYPIWQRRGLAAWRALEREVGEPLVVETGVAWLAAEDSGIEAESVASLAELEIPFERLDANELAARWPQLSTTGIRWALFEPEGGAIMARRGTAAAARRFSEEGGEVRRGLVVAPSPDTALDAIALGDGSRLEADAFVFACGPWLATLFPELFGKGRLAVTRQEVIYFSPPPGDDRFDAGQLPVWNEYGAAVYGIPSIEGRGLKVAPDLPGPIVDPDDEERRPSDERIDDARAYLGRRFPAMADRPVGESRVCQYESTPDAHFIIDRHPVWSNAWIVGGGSGHAFKHGPVIGEFLTARLTGDAALTAELAPPDDRFALRDRAPGGAGLRTAGAERAIA